MTNYSRGAVVTPYRLSGEMLEKYLEYKRLTGNAHLYNKAPPVGRIGFKTVYFVPAEEDVKHIPAYSFDLASNRARQRNKGLRRGRKYA